MQISANLDPEARSPLNALTGIRFWAALFIFLFHYGAGFAARFPSLRPVSFVLSHGYLGVSLFFILSGFILTYNYDRRLGKTKWISDFFVARMARLYPVYLLALLITLPVLASPLTSGQALAVLALIQAWTFPTSTAGYLWITQAWALSIEFFFYLIFPILLRPVCRLSARGILAGIALCWLLIVGIGLPTIGPDSHPAMTFLAYVPLPLLRSVEFLLGMLAGRFFVQNPTLLRRYAGFWPTVAVCLGIVGIAATFEEPRLLSGAVVLMSLLILLLGAGNNLITRMLSRPFMLKLGGASYAIYILQGPVRLWMANVGDSFSIRLLNPAVLIALSLAILFWFEIPVREAIVRKWRHYHVQ